MQNIMTQFSNVKDNLESVAFLVSKGDCEKEAHSKIIQSLVLLSQMELEINKLFNAKGFEQTHIPEAKNITTSVCQQNNVSVSSNKNSEMATEINKVQRRVPRWFKNPSQFNSTILFGFLELSEQQDKVTIQMLRSKCSVLSDFEGNYNQMKNFGEKNHGKVFEEMDGIITLWEPVKGFILELYKQQKV